MSFKHDNSILGIGYWVLALNSFLYSSIFIYMLCSVNLQIIEREDISPASKLKKRSNGELYFYKVSLVRV